MKAPASANFLSRRQMLLGMAGGMLGTQFDRHSSASEASDNESAVKRGIHWLLRQQGEDGGWHSETYGNMRDGAGNTALVLAALSQVPEAGHVLTQGAYERGVRFLTTVRDAQGLAQPSVGIADYPVYTTALLLTALAQRPVAVAALVKRRLLQGLLAAQRSSANGWATEHPDFGGWGLTVDRDAQATPASPSNLSATAHALLALQSHRALGECGVPAQSGSM